MSAYIKDRGLSVMKKKFTDISFLKLFLCASVFLVGGYHMAVSCFLSVLLLVFLIYKALSQKDFAVIKPNAVLAGVGLIVVSYLIVTLWAVDKGTAIYGFFKLLPTGLFAMVLSMYDKSTRDETVEVIPYVAVSNGVIAFALSFIPSLSDYFLVAERLGGFFQSPNAFAVFCLAGIIVLLTAEKISADKLILTAVLVLLIFLSGSRTVFVFLIITIMVLLFKIKNKVIRLTIFGIIAGAIAVSIIAVVATGSVQTLGRFLTISLESSTLLGRILYYIDAIPVILENPFGLGYYGYYFTQGSFQTGVYSVAFVHNSVLQYCLDIGVVPAIAFVVLAAASFFSKNTGFRQRLMIFAIFGHSMFDFDLEFTAILLVLVSVLDFDLFKKQGIKIHSYLLTGISAALIMFSVYFGLVNSLYLFGEYKAVDKVYGHDTMCKMHLITSEKNETTLLRYADEIIEENGYLAIAYDVKANASYKKGDFKRVMEYKSKAVRCAKYSVDEYTDYCEKLIVGISLYTDAGDTKSADTCKRRLVDLTEDLQEIKESTNALAWKIQDKPDLELPEEIAEIIKGYEEE